MNKPPLPLLLLAALTVFMMGFWIPETHVAPVQGGHPHKTSALSEGVEIVTQPGSLVKSSTGGVVVYKKRQADGTFSVTVLGSKWRLHHYSHLRQVDVSPLNVVRAGDQMGIVAEARNKRKRAFVHYAIQTLPPAVSQLDTRKPEGWKDVFYVNPGEFLNPKHAKAAH